MTTRHVALLRGINVGGKNRLPMKELSALFEGAGCTDVATYIQSGNVVFSSTDAAKAALRVQQEIARLFRFDAPVVTRTADEMRRVLDANPFLRAGAPEEQLHVAFLRDLPAPAQVASLDPARSPPDEFAVDGREVFLRMPDGVARSKLTNAWMDAKLSTVSTARNWRTVRALVEML